MCERYYLRYETAKLTTTTRRCCDKYSPKKRDTAFSRAQRFQVNNAGVPGKMASIGSSELLIAYYLDAEYCSFVSGALIGETVSRTTVGPSGR